jgi:hypothetical protein
MTLEPTHPASCTGQSSSLNYATGRADTSASCVVPSHRIVNEPARNLTISDRSTAPTR